MDMIAWAVTVIKFALCNLSGLLRWARQNKASEQIRLPVVHGLVASRACSSCRPCTVWLPIMHAPVADHALSGYQLCTLQLVAIYGLIDSHAWSGYQPCTLQLSTAHGLVAGDARSGCLPCRVWLPAMHGLIASHYGLIASHARSGRGERTYAAAALHDLVRKYWRRLLPSLWCSGKRTTALDRCLRAVARATRWGLVRWGWMLCISVLSPRKCPCARYVQRWWGHIAGSLLLCLFKTSVVQPAIGGCTTWCI